MDENTIISEQRDTIRRQGELIGTLYQMNVDNCAYIRQLEQQNNRLNAMMASIKIQIESNEPVMRGTNV